MTNGQKTKRSYLEDRRSNFPKSNKMTKKMKKPKWQKRIQIGTKTHKIAILKRADKKNLTKCANY